MSRGWSFHTVPEDMAIFAEHKAWSAVSTPPEFLLSKSVWIFGNFMLFLHISAMYIFSLYLPAIKKAYRRLSRRPTPGVTACHVQIVTGCHTSILRYARLFSKLENLWRRTEENLNRLCQTSWDFLRLLSVQKEFCFSVLLCFSFCFSCLGHYRQLVHVGSLDLTVLILTIPLFWSETSALSKGGRWVWWRSRRIWRRPWWFGFVFTNRWTQADLLHNSILK